MMTFKLMLGVVLVALYSLAWILVILLGLELAPRRLRAAMPKNADGVPNSSNSGKLIASTLTSVNDWGEEGARPSSLIPYYHHKPDRAYLLQLKYAVEKANEEAVRMYGPLPAGGLPVQKKPNAPYRDFQGNLVSEVPPINEENEMKLREIAVAAALAVGATACNSATPDNGDKTIYAHSADVTSAPSTPVATSSTANAPDEPKPTNGPLGPEYKTIDSFAEFRKKLLADGWRPVANPHCPDEVMGIDHKNYCSKYPDDISCRICDLVPEIFIYTSYGYLTARYTRDGMPLYVVAYGDIKDLEKPGQYGLVVTAWGYESLN